MTDRADDTNEHVLELLAAWALDAVDDLERVRVERHLRTCASCRATADALVDVAGQLAGAVPSVPPPPALRERVLRAVADADQSPDAASDSRRDTAAGGGRAGAGEPTGDSAVGDDATRPRRRGLLLVTGAAAAVVLVVAGATTAARLGDRVGSLEDDVDRIVALATEDTTRVWEATADGVQLQVLETVDGESFVLADGLARRDGGAWVLWSLTAGQPAKLDTLEAGRDVVALMQASPDDLDAVAVTFEPDPTVTAPTTEPVVVVALTAPSG